MPQFDPSTFPSQIFWLVICFGILFFVISRRVIPRIADIFHMRSSQIEGKHTEAETLKEGARKISEEVEELLAKARSEATEIINVANHEMNLQAMHRKSDYTSTLKRRIKASEQNITAKKKEAIDEVRNIAFEAAQSITGAVADVDIPNNIKDLVLSELLDNNEELSKDGRISNAS